MKPHLGVILWNLSRELATNKGDGAIAVSECTHSLCLLRVQFRYHEQKQTDRRQVPVEIKGTSKRKSLSHCPTDLQGLAEPNGAAPAGSPYDGLATLGTRNLEVVAVTGSLMLQQTLGA